MGLRRRERNDGHLGQFRTGRVRRSDAELYDIAKSINEPPIDVIVTFKIYPRFQRTGYSTKVNAELTGKVLSASKNQVIDNFQVKLPQDANAPKDCNRDCAVEVMGEYTRILTGSWRGPDTQAEALHSGSQCRLRDCRDHQH